MGHALILAADQVSGALGKPVQDHLLQARQMQTLSFVFHIPLVCFGIAFPAVMLFVEGLWLRTGDPLYKALARRWSKVVVVLFSIGVVSGTILSFEMGLLWPNFMATFGQVFGLAFGIEGFAFFTEAIFLALYVFGWDRFSPRTHLLLGVPVVIAGFLGSLMVISVNGWMNHPQGFDIVAGKVTNVDPWHALFNAHLWHELVHMYLAGYVVVGFVVAAIYARAWLRGRRDRYIRAAIVVPLTVACLAAPVQIVIGDWAGRTVAKDQPLKLAAFEGLQHTQRGATLHVGGIYEHGHVVGAIAIPKGLSLLAYHHRDAVVRGLDAVPPSQRPPVGVVRLAFQTMILIGTALAALGLGYLVVWWRRRRIPASAWFYRAVIAAAPLSLVALLAGWTTTEVGRQPWVVYGVMRTSQAVTSANGLLAAYALLAVVYLALAAAIWWLLRRIAREPIEAEVAGEIAVAA
ncbi:MAG: cytochrome bd ubiquinol oxidase subunit [Solirubrobacteraceae bacterium]|jgi:cytochrome d ubiquinol oxidase subunit I|nr:cytochrome bd ubiquinol oxidase subunit [Solirubrobacteraceae bacterium]